MKGPGEATERQELGHCFSLTCSLLVPATRTHRLHHSNVSPHLSVFYLTLRVSCPP